MIGVRLRRARNQARPSRCSFSGDTVPDAESPKEGNSPELANVVKFGAKSRTTITMIEQGEENSCLMRRAIFFNRFDHPTVIGVDIASVTLVREFGFNSFCLITQYNVILCYSILMNYCMLAGQIGDGNSYGRSDKAIGCDATTLPAAFAEGKKGIE